MMNIIVICMPLVSLIIALFMPGVYAEGFMRWIIPICLLLTSILSVAAAKQQSNYSSKNTILSMTALSQCVLIGFQVSFIFVENPLAVTNDLYAGLIVGVIMLVLGNFMPRTKPNAAFGLRLPWTLANEIVWRKSNRFAGFVMMLAGAIVVGLSLLFTENVEMIILSVLLCAVLVATLFSYSCHKKILAESDV